VITPVALAVLMVRGVKAIVKCNHIVGRANKSEGVLEKKNKTN
jgi:hypothetical protein